MLELILRHRKIIWGALVVRGWFCANSRKHFVEEVRLDGVFETLTGESVMKTVEE